MEGAGVKLHRAFGFGSTNDFDPFLLFDDFRGDDPSDYKAGFPWHPHRGIETITYVLAGSVEHGDSIGNSGSITAGDIQWMTAGSGIIHQEMPAGDAEGRMYGFQLWANLPSKLKMTKPRYQEFTSDMIPAVAGEDGSLVKVICGSYNGTRGPVEGIAADPVYLDVFVPAGVKKILPAAQECNAIAYIFEGSGKFCDTDADDRTLVHFGPGDEISVTAGAEEVRFLLFAGKPIKEPVAWYGPIVMNTQEELRTAFDELEKGTFLKNN